MSSFPPSPDQIYNNIVHELERVNNGGRSPDFPIAGIIEFAQNSHLWSEFIDLVINSNVPNLRDYVEEKIDEISAELKSYSAKLVERANLLQVCGIVPSASLIGGIVGGTVVASVKEGVAFSVAVLAVPGAAVGISLVALSIIAWQFYVQKKKSEDKKCSALSVERLGSRLKAAPKPARGLRSFGGVQK